MMLFRNGDRRWPFMWESANQPAARWHADGEGPVQYLADTPDGAWAEFLCHEEIDDPTDLAGVERSLWAVEADIDDSVRPNLPGATLVGGPAAYPQCQAEARRLRDAGAEALRAPSAALEPRSAGGYRVDRGLRSGPARDGVVFALFGTRPDAVGWQVVDRGRPPAALLDRVRALASAT